MKIEKSAINLIDEALVDAISKINGDYCSHSAEGDCRSDLEGCKARLQCAARDLLRKALAVDCPKCNIIRNQREMIRTEMFDLQQKLRAEIVELRKRIEDVSADRYTRDDELHYITMDLDSCLFAIGYRPDDQKATYGGAPRYSTIQSDLEYVRDMLQANYNFYKRSLPK